MLATALTLLVVLDNPSHAQGLKVAQHLKKLDGLLRVDVDQQAGGARRVLIRTTAADKDALRQLLASQGHLVLADVGEGDTLNVVVPAEALEGLAKSGKVLGISADAVVRPNADLLGGLLGTVTNTVDGTLGLLTGTLGTLVDTVGTVLDPALDDPSSGEPVPPAVLRATLGVQDAWTGRGVTVAVIDSGLEMSTEFQGRVKAFYDFTNGQTKSTSPFDDYGHGTHVAGTIAASGALSVNKSYRGLAPNVQLVVLKVLDANGAGLTSDVVRAIDFVVANKSKFGIDIINLSLGHPIYEPASTDPLVQAVERASKAGIVVLAAAGNNGVNPTTGQPGYAGINSPGNAPSAITVGAVATSNTVSRRDDRIPDYSSSGPTWYDALAKPDLLAPGHRIISVGAKRSTIYRDYPNLRGNDTDYLRLSGTSMATAVGSGVVALMIEQHRLADPYTPALTPNTVKAMLQYSALAVRNDLGLEYDPLREGAGALNGAGAVALARSVDTTSRTGSYWLKPQPLPYSTIGGENMTWGQAVIWGNAVIWGAGTMPVSQTAWGNAVIWGSGTNWANANAVIWGSNVVWEDPQTWGNAVIWGSGSIGTTDGTAVIWGSTGGMTAQNTAWKDIEPTGTGAQ
ncbi:MAG TPA: S8 family serine peptidase [Vicinamibacterales bacterium]|nr:S8 family serine peptidase [Vicinamibacterales bacterium]